MGLKYEEYPIKMAALNLRCPFGAQCNAKWK